jgi:hypothetical protein
MVIGGMNNVLLYNKVAKKIRIIPFLVRCVSLFNRLYKNKLIVIELFKYNYFNGKPSGFLV